MKRKEARTMRTMTMKSITAGSNNVIRRISFELVIYEYTYGKSIALVLEASRLVISYG